MANSTKTCFYLFALSVFFTLGFWLGCDSASSSIISELGVCFCVVLDIVGVIGLIVFLLDIS